MKPMISVIVNEYDSKYPCSIAKQITPLMSRGRIGHVSQSLHKNGLLPIETDY
jgi:hypothetical protein